jgi:hypothetical protein
MVSFNVYFIIVIEKLPCQAWWCMSVILALQKLRQEDCEFEAGGMLIVRPDLTKLIVHHQICLYQSYLLHFWNSARQYIRQNY